MKQKKHPVKCIHSRNVACSDVDKGWKPEFQVFPERAGAAQGTAWQPGAQGTLLLLVSSQPCRPRQEMGEEVIGKMHHC